MDKQPHKINIKARIDRHSRWLKENITLKNKLFSAFKKNNFLYKIVTWLMLLSVPIYPMFAWIIHNSNELEFYRWYIDEDSILGSYWFDYEKQAEVVSWDTVETQDDFLIDIGILNEGRNYEWTNEIRSYTIKSWDSISVIASKFWVSWDTIKIYNDLKNNTINPWKELKIPPTTGIPYIVKSWDSLLAIANKYEIEWDKILEFNSFDSSRKLKIWEEIFLPWAKRIIPKKPVVKKPVYTNTTKVSAPSTNYVWNQYTNSKWVYKLNWRKPYSGAWGNCTYYVASYKNVNWRWNANQWMRNAAAKGNKVVYGNKRPTAWAIISFAWRWYNLRYGHVWIVMEVKDDHMIISDMNYKRLNEVTYRKVSINDNRIVWYIYVD